MQKTNYRTPFKKIIDSLDGNTADLKKRCAIECKASLQNIHRYYSGTINIADIEFVHRFIDWANKNKVDGAKEITLADLLPNK